MTEQPPEPPKLPLAEAAVMLGKTTEAVRAMVRRGRLASVRGNNGKLLVAVPPELVRVHGRAAPDEQPGSDQLARLLVERDEALAEADHWREQAHQAKIAQAGAEAEAQAARDTAGARVAMVKAEVAAKDELIGELKNMLAEARRPWWRRWIGR